MKQPLAEKLVLACPAVCGVLLLSFTFADQALFRAGIIGARQAIGHELIFFVLGALSSLLLAPAVVYWLIKRRIKTAFVAALSCTLFCLAFYVAAENGAALVYAT